MGRNYYGSQKRAKEIKRLKKQEEKRQRRLEKKKDSAESAIATPVEIADEQPKSGE